MKAVLYVALAVATVILLVFLLKRLTPNQNKEQIDAHTHSKTSNSRNSISICFKKNNN
jgi:hypothetical protein